MKKKMPLLLIAFLVLASLFFIGTQNALASPIYANGQSIQLIDGPDTDTTVTFQISDYKLNFSKDVYYAVDSGEWTKIFFNSFRKADVGPYAGGSFIDLAIDFNDSTTIEGVDLFSRSDATLTYSMDIGALNAKNPTRTQDYYRLVDVLWNVGPAEFKLDILVPNDCGDGFAPVPIPSAVWLLGSGLIGLVGLRGRFRKRFI